MGIRLDLIDVVEHHSQLDIPFLLKEAIKAVVMQIHMIQIHLIAAMMEDLLEKEQDAFITSLLELLALPYNI